MRKPGTRAPYLAFMRRVRTAVGDDVLLGARVSFYEGVPNGWGARYDPSLPADLPLGGDTAGENVPVEMALGLSLLITPPM